MCKKKGTRLPGRRGGLNLLGDFELAERFRQECPKALEFEAESLKNLGGRFFASIDEKK